MLRSAPLREAVWLSPARGRAVRTVLLIILPLTALAWLAMSRGGIDPAGKALGTDYLSFWSAARIALGGKPAAVYDIALHHATQRAALGAEVGYAAFFYPPVFLLVVLPFGLLPYLASLGAWLAVTGYAYWRAVRLWAAGWAGAGAAFLAYPALLVNAGHGQNGFLSAALLGAGAFLTQKRPWLAGALLGGLIIKPHLALLVPVALILRGLWRPFLAAGGGALGLLALSVVAFGAETWRGFLTTAPLARATLEQGLVEPEKMQSLFAAVRMLGGGLAPAYALQGAMGIVAVAGLALVARKRADDLAQGAVLVSGTLLATPFLLDYDLTLAAIPLAWVFVEARRAGFLSYEKIVLGAAFLLPLVSRGIAMKFHVPFAPLLLFALFAIVVRRAVAQKAVRENGKPRLNPLES